MAKYKLNIGNTYTTYVDADSNEDIDNLISTCLAGKEVSVVQL